MKPVNTKPQITQLVEASFNEAYKIFMTEADKFESFVETASASISQLTSDIGTMESLQTTNKDSLVNAINEVKGTADSVIEQLEGTVKLEGEQTVTGKKTFEGGIKVSSMLNPPVESSAAVGYDEEGNLIPIRFLAHVSLPSNANYLATDTQGNALAKTADTTPTPDSPALITSGGVAEAINTVKQSIAGKQDSLNPTQLNAVNSGIDSAKVAQIETNTNSIGVLTGLDTTVKTDLVNAINEIVADNVLNSSFLIIHNDTKLRNVSNAGFTAGRNLYIKSGEYTATDFTNVAGMVVCEPGVIFRGKVSNYKGVAWHGGTVEVTYNTNTSSNIAVDSCSNMYRVKVSCTLNVPDLDPSITVHSITAYSECSGLIECSGTANINATSSNPNFPPQGSTSNKGFHNCTNLQSCEATAVSRVNRAKTTQGVVSGFSECTRVFHCKATSSGSGRYYNSYASSSKTSDYACADTANGGFNS